MCSILSCLANHPNSIQWSSQGPHFHIIQRIPLPLLYDVTRFGRRSMSDGRLDESLVASQMMFDRKMDDDSRTRGMMKFKRQ